jgi:hypothetical protein
MVVGKAQSALTTTSVVARVAGMERLTQSIAKVLVTQCPAVARYQLDHPEEKKPSREMNLGSLVDQMVFGGAGWHTIDADSYRTKKAQQERDAAYERGQIPVLAKDVEDAQRLAGRIRSRLMEEGIDLQNCRKQERLEWTSPSGTLCAGTPDLALLHESEWVTVDLKVGARTEPVYLGNHVVDQGWHIQAAAYQEAGHGLYPHTQRRGRHLLLAAETGGTQMVQLHPFSEMMMDMGRHAWVRAQQIWIACHVSGEWPEYPSRELMPSNWAYESEMGR